MADGCDTAESSSVSAETKQEGPQRRAKVCRSETSIVLQIPRSGQEEVDTPVPAPRNKISNKKVPTLLVLFPPEGIKKGQAKEKDKKVEILEKKNIFIEPKVEELKASKDLASLIHPTAPRVPAPDSSVKSPPPTVRGPKGVNHPQLSELLKSCKAKYKVIFEKKPQPKQNSPPKGLDENRKEQNNDANRSESGSSSSRSSSDNPDAYADLVHELARHEEAVKKLSNMPVHETAFLPATQQAPQRGYDTTDDELDGILRSKQRREDTSNLRQQNVIRVIKPAPLNNVVIRNNLTSPTNRYDMERYQQLLREQNMRLMQQQHSQNGHLPNGQQHLVRNGPLRASLNRTYPASPQQPLQPPMMQRSYSLNAEQVRAARRMNGGGTPTSPKRVSFSTLPNPASPNPARDRVNGVPAAPLKQMNGGGSNTLPSRQTRSRPVSSDSVFFHKPLPPVPEARTWLLGGGRRTTRAPPESESGSEAGEIQRILFNGGNRIAPSYVSFQDDEWSDGKPRLPGSDPNAPAGSKDEDLRRGGSRGRRDDPRRHTLAGDQQGGPASAALTRSMDLESSASLQRSYYHQQGPISSSMFDDDPGIMSEVETASTGFRRGGKQRSSLPVVRTPSKTLERPLGLVFLQYRNETKRALLPNEITSIDTVKALFVRSFPKQLTMEYLDSPMVKIYIHDSSKDMFYELEDLRSHLREIRDRSVLRLFESADVNGGAMPVGTTPLPGGLPAHPSPANWDQDQSYFSEPEFDSEFQHQHIHKSKGSKGNNSTYYLQHSYPPGQPGAGGSATLPRPPGIRAYSPATKPVTQAVCSTPLRQQRIYQEIGPRDSLLRSPPSQLRSPTSPVQRPQSTPPRPPERWAYSRSRDLYSESGYMSSPERGRQPYSNYPPAGAYEDPYYAQYGPRSGSITPVIDEEASDSDELLMEAYGIYGNTKGGSTTVAAAAARIHQPSPRPPSFPSAANMINSQTGAALMPYDATRLRVENMERQLANLTGLVQKALTQGPQPSPTYLQIPNQSPYRNDDYDKHSSSSSASLPDESYLRAETTTPTTKTPKLGKDKSVSFEKSVSFSDDPPDMLSSPKQHTPQHSADTKPTKPAIKSSTLPRMSSQDRDRHKPAPPPKPMALAPHTGQQYDAGRHLYRADLQLTPEMYNHLRVLQKKAKDLRQEVRNLRRMSQAQAHSVRETIRDTFIKIRALLLTGGGDSWLASGDTEKLKVSREEELYKQEMIRLEKDLTELESTVEELRGNVINKKTRVNMSDVENMALVLSKSSKTVADLKVRFPNLQDGMKSLLSNEMERVVREEKFLKEEPERLESALRRCKKLTGTLVTLKRLASVQEQRLPVGGNAQDPQLTRLSPDNLLQDQPPQSGAISPQSKSSGDGCSTPCGSAAAAAAASAALPARGVLAAAGGAGEATKRQENALDTLLDELQTFARPPSTEPATPGGGGGGGTLRRLHSYPSGSDSSSPVRSSRADDRPPSLPERSKVPPPPPPRTSSKSPLVSPTSPPRLQPRGQNLPPAPGGGGTLRRKKAADPPAEDGSQPAASNSSSSESINSQEGLKNSEALEQRHQELLRRQKQLQEQYARLQQLQRNVRLPTGPELKKTGSESNLLRGLNLSAAPTSGSLTHLAPASMAPVVIVPPPPSDTAPAPSPAAAQPTANKVYETDIL